MRKTRYQSLIEVNASEMRKADLFQRAGINPL